MIRDEFTDRTDLSRQRRYQLRCLRKGRCAGCGKAKVSKGEFCEFCRLTRNVRARETARRRLGAKKRQKSAESYAFEAALRKLKQKHATPKAARSAGNVHIRRPGLGRASR